jgi:hypothetical protein
MAETEKPAASGPNEGEGNRTAARHYNEGVQNFVRSGKVEEKAKEARDALDSPEGENLRRAEEKGKSYTAEQDPQLNKG